MKDWHKLKPELFKKNPYYLTGCDIYPPVVEYSCEEQRRAADEDDALPEESIIVERLADYAVLRAQVRACSNFRRE